MSVELHRARLLRAAIGQAGPVEPERGDWTAWTALALRDRVVPQLYVAAAERPDLLDEAQLTNALDMQLDVAALMVFLEHRFLEVDEIFREHGLRFAVLKGGATAHLDHPDPSRRQFGDIDLLVSPDDFACARRLLEARSWRQAYPLPRYHERSTHAVTFRGSGGAEIDLHQRIAHRALGLLVPTSELLAARVPFDLAGRQVWALCDLDRLIHASIHAVASRGNYRRLSSVADVLLLSQTLQRAAEQVIDRAERWRVRPLVEAAICDAHRAARLPVPEPWATSMGRPIRRRERLVERAYLGGQRRPATEELAHLRHMAGWGDRLIYLYGHLRMDSGPGSGGLVPRLRYLRSRLRQRS